ncbi:MAG: tetratricopeptide repeat protein, partial [Acidobacteriota bacterium]
WAERFQEERRELFALEDRITGRIANTLGIQLVQAAARGTDASKSDPNAADLVMQGRALMSLPESRENVDQAVALFRQAVAVDDRSVEANVGLANALTSVLLNFFGELGPERDDLLRQANEAADRALTLDPDAAAAHEVKGVILRSEHKNLESTHEFEIAIARDPNSASAYDNLGAAMYRLGQPEKAIPFIEKALRLSPRDTALSIFEWHLGTAYLFLHDYDRAIEHFLKARAANPQFVWQLFHLAGAYALKGDDEIARAYLADALKWRPKATMKGMRAVRESNNPDYLRMREETLITGLRRAGLPEQ